MGDWEKTGCLLCAQNCGLELEVTDQTCRKYIMIPHGFGLEYRGKTHGVNANRLARNTHRDRFAGTPFHRYIPCRVEKV
jgi:hypothetical protein